MSAEPGWQLERASAELYERFLVGPVTSVWARDLVERVASGRRPACWTSRAGPAPLRASQRRPWGEWSGAAQRDRIVGLVSAEVSEALAALVSGDGFEFPQEAHVALAAG